MGIDGSSTLEIRGPTDELNRLEESLLIVPKREGEPEQYESLRTWQFGRHVKSERAKKNVLYFFFAFRNEPIVEYLNDLLAAQPRCWFKQTFETETGGCGLWIGQVKDEKPVTQFHEWQELDWYELSYQGTDDESSESSEDESQPSNDCHCAY